jgi:hypothetical protein
MSARRETTEGIDLAHAEAGPEAASSMDRQVAGHAGARDEVDAAGVVGAPAAANSAPCVTATHAALFVADETVRCDVCDELVVEDSDEGYAVTGRGLYVWARGDDVRYEEPHLCAGCAAAVGVSALARWEIEEEEG